MPSFAVIYRMRVKQGCEADYLAYWKAVAGYFIRERGAIESRSHQAEDGLWIAYSRWPSRAMRDASWPAEGEEVNSALPPHIQEAIRVL